MTVKSEYFKGTPRSEITKKVLKIIGDCLKNIHIAELRRATQTSLLNFYNKQYRTISELRGYKLLLLLACIKIATKSDTLVKMPVSRAEKVINQYAPTVSPQIYNESIETYDTVNLYGVPLQKFSKDYIEKEVNPVYDRLLKQEPKDPDDYTGRNTLRNRAEMEVRYNGHLENIENLKEQGNRLVIASVHADCSERCRQWQGRVYSLDGTSGKTPDGRQFIPLETATQIPYTTKAGKTYMNGLLGFNCRHFLVPYKNGYKFPKPNPETEAKEYKITQRQRALEREVRYWRKEAIMYKDTHPEYYRIARQTAIEKNKEYIKYSKENGRAYYPSRTTII